MLIAISNSGHTLVYCEYGLNGVKDKCHGDHDGPNTHAGAGHPEHEEGHEDLL